MTSNQNSKPLKTDAEHREALQNLLEKQLAGPPTLTVGLRLRPDGEVDCDLVQWRWNVDDYPEALCKQRLMFEEARLAYIVKKKEIEAAEKAKKRG